MRPSFEGIEDASERMRPHVHESPLIRSELLSRAFGASIWIKNETISPIACFKVRGALTDLLRARAKGALAGAVTSSTGNHGQGVAYASRLLGLPAHIFLPRGPNPVKRAAIAVMGAQIHEVGSDIDEVKEAGRAFARQEGLHFVDDGESLDVIEGNGTVGLEIGRALPHIDHVFVPMGSGSLASGCGVALRTLHPSAKIVAVQASGAPAMVRSFVARAKVSCPIDTMADGLVCRDPAELALASVLAFVHEAQLVSEADLLSAMHTLVGSAHLLAEPSGAASLAGAWNVRAELAGRVVVLVLTGANVIPDLLAQALRSAPLFPFG